MERLKRFGLLVLVVGGMGACGAGLDQRILSATATAAVTADRSARTLYLAEADRVLQTAEDRDESFAWYCREVQGVWGRMADLQCAAVAVGANHLESCSQLVRVAEKSLALFEDERASVRKRCAAGDRAAKKFWEAKVCARTRRKR